MKSHKPADLLIILSKAKKYKQGLKTPGRHIKKYKSYDSSEEESSNDKSVKLHSKAKFKKPVEKKPEAELDEIKINKFTKRFDTIQLNLVNQINTVHAT